MDKRTARSLAKELVEGFDEDIVTTCEGVSEDIVKLRTAAIRSRLGRLNSRDVT